MNDINIIIPHFKHDCYLPETIVALLQQDYPGHSKILIMNDEPYVDLSPYEDLDARITVYDSGDINIGQSARFNQGILASTLKNTESKFVAFNGADDISMPWRLKQSIRGIKGYDVIYTDAIQLNDNLKRQYIKSQPFDSEVLRHRNFIVASTVVIRTEVAREVLFDEDIRYGEDWLWYNKLNLAGAKFHYVPIPTVYYRDYTSNIDVRYSGEWENKKRELRGRIQEMYYGE